LTTTHSVAYTSHPPALEPKQPECCGIGWGVVRTNPLCEHLANANLKHRGCETFLPTFASRSIHGSIVQRPLFPSYLFVAFADPTVWRPVRETPGIHSVLVSGNHAQTVPTAAVEALQASQHLRTIPPPPNARIAPGSAVSLNTGPFRRSHAVVATRHGSYAIICLMFLGELRTVQVPVDHLSPIQ